MSWIHCSQCHHEYYGSKVGQNDCDWCGAPEGEVLEEKTSFEALLEDWFSRQVDCRTDCRTDCQEGADEDPHSSTS